MLKEEATTEKLQQLCAYIEDTWLNSTIWKPKEWSVVMLAIRTTTTAKNGITVWRTRVRLGVSKRFKVPYPNYRYTLIHRTNIYLWRDSVTLD